MMSRATVYKTLDTLKGAGEVLELEFREGPNRYKHWSDGIGKTNASHQKKVLDNPLGCQIRDNLHIEILADCFLLSDSLSSCR